MIFWRVWRGEADVTRLLLVAGDTALARGPFKSSLDLCAQADCSRRAASTRLSVAGHPEGHPYLETDEALAGLGRWRQWGLANKIRVDVMTQFCFESAPILGWIGGLDARGIKLPVTVGSRRSGDAGHADEVRAPLRHRQLDAGGAQPDRSLRPALDRHRAGRGHARAAVGAGRSATAPIAGFHLFPFGGLRKAGDWLRSHGPQAQRPGSGAGIQTS